MFTKALATTFGLVLVATVLSPQRGLAASTRQCDGDNAAIVNACGARWGAANVRAHLAAGKLGGNDQACLLKTAIMLESIASKWQSTNTFTTFAGTYPCGAVPSVAVNDDGVLAKACPGKIWSYENSGVVPCTAGPSSSAPGVDLPSLDDTMTWLHTNVPIFGHFNRTITKAPADTNGPDQQDAYTAQFTNTECKTHWTLEKDWLFLETVSGYGPAGVQERDVYSVDIPLDAVQEVTGLSLKKDGSGGTAGFEFTTLNGVAGITYHYTSEQPQGHGLITDKIYQDSTFNMLPFDNESDVNRIIKAVNHAINLCKSKTGSSPF